MGRGTERRDRGVSANSRELMIRVAEPPTAIIHAHERSSKAPIPVASGPFLQV